MHGFPQQGTGGAHGHHLLDLVAAEDAEDVVLEGEEEARAAGVALAARAAAQLVVDAPRLVPLGADDVQAAQARDVGLLRRALGLVHRLDRLERLAQRQQRCIGVGRFLARHREAVLRL